MNYFVNTLCTDKSRIYANEDAKRLQPTNSQNSFTKGIFIFYEKIICNYYIEKQNIKSALVKVRIKDVDL